MTADLVLGPAGVLPPYPVGARVRRPGRPWRGTIVSPVVNGRCDVDWRGATDDEWRDTESVAVATLCLDLSPPHRLDAPARTLWDILHLGEQPPTAPWWGRSVRSSWGPGWTLRLPGFTGDATTISIFSRLEAPADSEGDVCVEDADGYIVCTAAAEEEDPRQALALTLAAVAESRR